MLTLVRSKLFWGAAFILLIAGMTGVIDLPGGSGQEAHGPRDPGFNEQFNCRFMTVEVETAFTNAQLASGVETIPARITADLGTAGKVSETIQLVDSDRGIYKREFCAKSGSRLRADVVASAEVDSLGCYFMSGPDDVVDNETTAFGPSVPQNYRLGAANQISAWCIGIVP